MNTNHLESIWLKREQEDDKDHSTDTILGLIQYYQPGDYSISALQVVRQRQRADIAGRYAEDTG